MKKRLTVFIVVILAVLLCQSLAFAAEPAALSPVYGGQITDGSYDIEVESNSSMFKIIAAKLTAEGGKLSCVITLNGTGYGKLYVGTGEQAASAAESDFIAFVADENGKYTYELPVSMLNTEIAVAAWSTKKSEWYDRTLVFKSEGMPQGSVKIAELPESGEYTVDVALSGGSGRASVTSPAVLTVKDNIATAKIIWSSDSYGYMKVGGVQYDPVQTEGNSTFEIPVVLDCEMPIIAQTTAMSTPREVEYTLLFSSSSVKSEKAKGNMIYWLVACGAAIVLIVLFVLRRKKKTA